MLVEFHRVNNSLPACERITSKEIELTHGLPAIEQHILR